KRHSSLACPGGGEDHVWARILFLPERVLRAEECPMTIHIVQQGEHLTGIAHKYGFYDYQTIWGDAQNEALRKERPNPHVLYPGDEVYIPEKAAKSVSIPTGQAHRFKLKGRPLKLRLAVQDWNGNPIKNTPCTLVVEQQTYKLQTD